MAEDCAQDRRHGFAQALQAVGITPQPDWVREGNWQPTSGYEAFMNWQQQGQVPTAVFAQNDQMALGVLRAARDCGLQIPAQLSIIGVDDIPLASHFAPPLTTLRQDFARIGREAAQLLLQVVEEPDRPKEHLQIEAELILRRSTARP
jgi:DNA-binding LacI/PurR family transcriptional regulator